MTPIQKVSAMFASTEVFAAEHAGDGEREERAGDCQKSDIEHGRDSSCPSCGILVRFGVEIPGPSINISSRSRLREPLRLGCWCADRLARRSERARNDESSAGSVALRHSRNQLRLAPAILGDVRAGRAGAGGLEDGERLGLERLPVGLGKTCQFSVGLSFEEAPKTQERRRNCQPSRNRPGPTGTRGAGGNGVGNECMGLPRRTA